MTGDTHGKNPQPPLVDRILRCGKSAFDPGESESTRRANILEFHTLLESTSALALIPVLNLLTQPGRVQPWFRAPLASALARIPLRPRGVQHTIEFVFQVHANSHSSRSSSNTGRGASISHESLNSASRLLSSPPVGMSAEDWFAGIAPQLHSLLDGEGELDMDRTAAFVIGFGILGKKQFGAPGTPGWNAFVVPILGSLDPAAVRSGGDKRKPLEDSIDYLGGHKVLVTSADVAKGVQRLLTLLASHPHPSLSKRLLRPVLLPLWSLSFWPNGNEHNEKKIRDPAKKLLRTLLQVSPASADAPVMPSPPSTLSLLSTILRNINFKGRSETGRVRWVYATAENGDIQIEELKIAVAGDNQFNLISIDTATEAFISLLQSTPDLKNEISKLFMSLCKNWLANSAKTSKPSITTRSGQRDDTQADIESRLIEAKVMQKMMNSFPESLVDDSRQALDLVNEVLLNFLATQDGGEGSEDSVAVVLSILNIVLSSPSFTATLEMKTILTSIESCLRSLSLQGFEVSSTAQNLLLLLEFRGSIDNTKPASMSAPTDRQSEDRKSYSLAMSYLTATDSPPPVRVHGLELLSDLIRADSVILNIPALLVLFSSLLQDDEEYIYLRVIKSFIQLSRRHPKSVMKDLIDRYVDPQEGSELDQRLRLGEALLQVIQNNPLAFTGETSTSVCEGLLFIAGRRGHRPKTEQHQEKMNRLKRKKNIEAAEAWGGEVPQLDEVLGEAYEESEIMSQIVTGWESQRGLEDVRIRASALSVLGSSIEANIEGIGSRLISTAVDLSIHILTLEPEPEKGILRRAAMLLLMYFVKALDSARAAGKKLGFGIVGDSLDNVRRIVKYVEGSDGDGLVRQHARDVIEGLEAWQINALIPPQREWPSRQELAGLRITPRGAEDSNGRIKPRIEEVE
ncbi:protein required for cell viability [Diplocarpon rosae]|nr:protein required for cell viability [Diplocarpon rosae]